MVVRQNVRSVLSCSASIVGHRCPNSNVEGKIKSIGLHSSDKKCMIVSSEYYRLSGHILDF